MVPPKLQFRKKLLICTISCSFCTYTVIHVGLWHHAEYDYDGGISKIIGFLVYLVPVSGVMCNISGISQLVPATGSPIPVSGRSGILLSLVVQT